MINHSTYATNAFWVMFGAFAGASLLFSVATLILVRCALAPSPSPTGFLHGSALPRIVAGTFTAAVGFFILVLALISGFQFMHPAISIALACVLWYLATATSMYILFAAWRPMGGATTYTKRFATNSGAAAFVVALRRAITICVSRARTFNAVCITGYVVCYAVVFAMYGMCYCTNPFQITTWSSRRSQAKYCFEGQFCHQYVMLGRNYSRVRLVGHVITALGSPLTTSALLCPFNEATELPECGSTGARSLQGAIVPHLDDLNEDARYLSHILVTNLLSDTAYYANVSITLHDGSVTSSTMTFRTVPRDRTELTFISGGDMLSTNDGQWFLFVALAARSNPAFVLFGGDLSYSNNMRTCFLRFDYFCAAISSLRNSRGRSIPLLIIPGNHESGGYLPEGSDWGKYFFFLPYFPQYDDDAPPTPFITHHSHEIGQLTVLGLDSGLMESVESQVPYVSSTMLAAAAKNHTLIAAYHNPMYPSVRNFGDDNSVAVRGAFLSIFLQYNLTLGLEFHDHAFKRTYLVNDRNGPSPDNTDGITFIGDGGMGTSRDAASSGDHPYLARIAGICNVQVVLAHVNGSLTVTTLDQGAIAVDTVLIAGRTRHPMG